MFELLLKFRYLAVVMVILALLDAMTILTTLLIAGLSQLIEGLFTRLDWAVLLTPLAILILALSLFFMKRA
jgi:hypothetical protein